MLEAEKTECSLLTLSSGDLSTSEAQLPQKRGKNGTEMGKLKVWMKTGSHYPTISGSSLVPQQFSWAPEHTWSFLLLRGTFPKEYHNLIKKSSLLLFMLRFLQTTKPPSPCPLPNEFNITSPQADYLWAMNFFPAPEVPHSCYSTVPWGKHKLPSAVSAECGFCVTLFPGMETCLVMWQHTSSMCFPAPTILAKLRFICNVIISKHLLGQLTTHRGKS